MAQALNLLGSFVLSSHNTKIRMCNHLLTLGIVILYLIVILESNISQALSLIEDGRNAVNSKRYQSSAAKLFEQFITNYCKTKLLSVQASRAFEVTP